MGRFAVLEMSGVRDASDLLCFDVANPQAKDLTANAPQLEEAMSIRPAKRLIKSKPTFEGAGLGWRSRGLSVE